MLLQLCLIKHCIILGINVGQYPRSKLGTRRVVNKGIICGIDGRQTVMRTQ